VSPILGIYASQISGHLFAPSGAYDSIATVTVGAGGTSTVSFTSIPQGYTHLQIRAFGHTNRSTGAGGDGTRFNFNSDTGSNYTGHSIEADGSTAIAFTEGTSVTKYAIYGLTGNTGATTFGTFIVDILDYSSTNKYKTARALTGFDNNGSGYVYFSSGLWMSTSAITRIDLTPNAGTLFNQYSSFALYGIKGA
jgi:hypothetical protein